MQNNSLLTSFLELKILIDSLQDDKYSTLIEEIKEEISINQIYSLLKQRHEAKNQKDYALADQIRAQLQEAGIKINDRKNSVTLSFID